MRVLGDHPQPLSQRDHAEFRLRCAIGGGEDHQAAGRKASSKLGDERGGIGNMLDHFKRGDEVEMAFDRCKFGSDVINR